MSKSMHILPNLCKTMQVIINEALI